MKKNQIKIKTIKIKKKKIQKNLRLAVIAILGLILIISAYSTYGAYAAYEQPITTEESIPVVEYTHTGTFNYVVYLKNNTVYNTNILYPGQGNIFKKITNHINASLAYRFSSSQSADIDGSYEITAMIQTDMWSKEYIVTSKTTFSSDGNAASFSTNFSIDYVSFENIVSQINNETGMTAADTTLIMKCNIDITAKTNNGTVYDSFAPSLSIPLRTNIIEINGNENLTQYESGVLEKTEEVIQQTSIEQSIYWGLASVVFLVVLAIFLIFTKSDKTTISKTDKQVKKILKKYGEWIVEVEQLPETKKTGAVSVKTMDDLIKISEELGKPIIHYQNSSNPDGKHAFYVLDGKTTYQYVLNIDEGITKTVQCPHCNSITVCNVDTNKEINVICSKCGNEFNVSFEEDNNLLIKLYSFITGKK